MVPLTRKWNGLLGLGGLRTWSRKFKMIHGRSKKLGRRAASSLPVGSTRRNFRVIWVIRAKSTCSDMFGFKKIVTNKVWLGCHDRRSCWFLQDVAIATCKFTCRLLKIFAYFPYLVVRLASELTFL